MGASLGRLAAGGNFTGPTDGKTSCWRGKQRPPAPVSPWSLPTTSVSTSLTACSPAPRPGRLGDPLSPPPLFSGPARPASDTACSVGGTGWWPRLELAARVEGAACRERAAAALRPV